jgi:hypothetical protein
MINRLVVNGCSYMAYYHRGGGTEQLAEKINIKQTYSLAENSVCNSRILRTTLKDLYSATVPSLYIVGITFVHRYELTVLKNKCDDGYWQSFNGHTTHNVKDCHDLVTLEDLNAYSRAWNSIIYDKELFDDLIYRVCSLVDAAKSQGHKILVFNTAEHLVDFVDFSKYKFLKNKKEIIEHLYWRSIPWQLEQGADFPEEDSDIYPENCRHVRPGDHKWLNNFLLNYIKQHKIL